MDRTHPYEGIPELLSTLADRGYRMAIVSNKVDEAVKALAAHFFGDTITVAIGNSDRIKRKPAPDTVYAALEELGVPAEDAVYVGDSEVDLATARAAGLPCITVLWGFREKELLIREGADCMVERPEEILQVLTAEERKTV
jgi:phosphoglycolate phosphatase